METLKDNTLFMEGVYAGFMYGAITGIVLLAAIQIAINVVMNVI